MAVRQVRVGDVLQQVRRMTPVSATYTYPMVGARNFARGSFDAGSLRGADTKYKELQLVEAGDLIYPKLGAWEGAFAFVDENLGHRYTSPEYCVFTICSAEAEAAYLRHLFAWEPFWRSLAANSTGTNVRRRRLQPSAFLDGSLPLPDLPEQEHIATRLDGVASMTGYLKRTRAGLARVKARILAISEVSTYPARPLGDLLRTARIPIDIQADESYRPLGVRSFGKGLIRYPSTKGDDLSKLRYFSVKPDRLVVSNIKAWEGAVAMTCVGDENLVASNRFLQWEAADPAAVDLQFLRLFFGTPLGLSLLGQASPGSADRNRTLSSQRFLELAVPLPPLRQQHHLVDLASQVEAIDAQLEQRDVVSKALLTAARNEAFAELT
ncbi:hypothetical protein [Knoellia alttitudinis]|uniref:hypothetical protein n=2 Tax=Knoellia altitudinis TaxID=3404795 RepID=UPI00360E4ACB